MRISSLIYQIFNFSSYCSLCDCCINKTQYFGCLVVSVIFCVGELFYIYAGILTRIVSLPSFANLHCNDAQLDQLN